MRSAGVSASRFLSAVFRDIRERMRAGASHCAIPTIGHPALIKAALVILLLRQETALLHFVTSRLAVTKKKKKKYGARELRVENNGVPVCSTARLFYFKIFSCYFNPHASRSAPERPGSQAIYRLIIDKYAFSFPSCPTV